MNIEYWMNERNERMNDVTWESEDGGMMDQAWVSRSKQWTSLLGLLSAAPPNTYSCLSKATMVCPYLLLMLIGQYSTYWVLIGQYLVGGGGQPLNMCSVEILVQVDDLKWNWNRELFFFAPDWPEKTYMQSLHSHWSVDTVFWLVNTWPQLWGSYSR